MEVRLIVGGNYNSSGPDVHLIDAQGVVTFETKSQHDAEMLADSLRRLRAVHIDEYVDGMNGEFAK